MSDVAPGPAAVEAAVVSHHMGPARAAFMLFGAFWGTWAILALDVQEFLGAGEGGLGLLMASTVVGGACTNAVGGVLTERIGTSRMLSGALAAWGVALVLTALQHTPAGFAAAFLVAIAMGGLVDVVMNVAGAAATTGDADRLLRMHALYNVGSLGGAVLAGIAVDQGLEFHHVWPVVGGLALAVALWTSMSHLPGSGAGEQHAMRAGLATLRRPDVRPVAILLALGALLEGGMGTWGVLFLRSQLDLDAGSGALAFGVGAVLATISRLGSGRLAARIGGWHSAQLGLAVAGAGLALQISSANPVAASAGLAVAAMGVALCWPSLIAHATRTEARPGLVLGGLSTCGYVGYLVGPPLIGAIAEVVGLRAAVAILAATALAGAAVATRIRND